MIIEKKKHFRNNLFLFTKLPNPHNFLQIPHNNQICYTINYLAVQGLCPQFPGNEKEKK